MNSKNKTTEERLDALEAELAATPRRGKWLNQYENDLRTHALAYARMSRDGIEIDSDGCRYQCHESERAALADYFVKQMKADALRLLQELSIEEP